MNEKNKRDLEKLKKQNQQFSQASNDWRSFSKGMMVIYGIIVFCILVLIFRAL